MKLDQMWPNLLRCGAAPGGALGPLRAHVCYALAALLAVCPAVGQAHDASSWGGLFRSRDGGATWFQANQGRLVAGALSVAIDPAQSDHILLGADDALVETTNGGRDWTSTPGAPSGPVFAIAADGRGQHILIATAGGVFRSMHGSAWESLATPQGASPVRALVRGETPGRIYLLGWRGLVRSDDWGSSWAALNAGLPDAPVVSLAELRTGLLCVADGQVWASGDEGQHWQHRTNGLPDGQVQMLTVDGQTSLTAWAAASDRLLRTTDAGHTWQPVGQPVPDRETEIRGIAASRDHARLVLSTHRGVYATVDGGLSWSAMSEGLPGHVEAGPLLRDPGDPDTLYVGFALTPYREQWQRAAEGRSSGAKLAPLDLVGALAFLLLLAVVSFAALQWLAGRRAPRAEAGLT